MYSRTGINDMLAELSADMPRMLRDRNTFFREFEDRSELILGAAAPEDQAYVLEVLQAFVDRSGVNDQFHDLHAA
ncbi:MAG: hypothetical protein EOO81_01640 [Oxalobacteraceae bacterium]|nr:MAG: hypothetical protein EOO81_01640 [Oxalobacteraceae bacterium]